MKPKITELWIHTANRHQQSYSIVTIWRGHRRLNPKSYYNVTRSSVRRATIASLNLLRRDDTISKPFEWGQSMIAENWELVIVKNKEFPHGEFGNANYNTH